MLTPSLPIPVPDCGEADPSQQELREQLEDAVRVAERFTRRYDSLLREFQEEMLNTSGLLDQLNRQFGWVSRLANYSQGPEGFLQVTTVRPPGSGPGAGLGTRKVGQSHKGPFVLRPGISRLRMQLRDGSQGQGPSRGSPAAPGAVPTFPTSQFRGFCRGVTPAWLSQVLSKAPNPEDPSAPPDTQVTVQLFDSEPLALTVPGDIPWDDPRFMEIVAEQALQHFKENSM